MTPFGAVHESAFGRLCCKSLFEARGTVGGRTRFLRRVICDRQRHGDERVYTFWHYLRNRWQRNDGLRLDHILLSPSLPPRLRDAGVDRVTRG